MSNSDSSEVETHGNIFDDPPDYYKPTPPPTTQTYTSLTHPSTPITLHLVGYSPTEAHHLWNGARVISEWFEASPALVKDKTILELGAGAGLPSIIAGVLGARKVLVTDYPDPDIVETMERNVDICTLLPDKQVVVPRGYVWGANPQPLLAELPGEGEQKKEGFDVLILADLLFRHTEHGNMLKTVEATLKREDEARAYVFFTSYRPWLRHKDLKFFELARERGFVVEKVLERKMERPMFVDDPGDEEVRKTCTGWVLRWPREGEDVVITKEEVTGEDAQ